MLALIAAALLGYLLGSIPFGLILTRMGGTADLRSVGSGNIGATNVLRTGRKGLAAATLLGDMLKGTAAVMIAGEFAGTEGAMLAGLFAFLGHIFPVWLRFAGGKGVATYIGVLLGLFWPAALFFCGVWLIVALLSRYSSLAALLASLAMPVLFALQQHTALAVMFALMTLLLWIMHRGNLVRLVRGHEGKIGAQS